jgi:hypothetical protein
MMRSFEELLERVRAYREGPGPRRRLWASARCGWSLCSLRPRSGARDGEVLRLRRRLWRVNIEALVRAAAQRT